MTAKEYIKEHVKEASRDVAVVLAHIDKKTWFHVHWDEELPDNHWVSIKVRSN